MRIRVLTALAIIALCFTPILAAQPPKNAADNQAPAKTAEKVELPQPSRAGGMSLNEAMARRRSVRSFTATVLTQQEISQLLWAAQGITDDKGHRTAPSAHAGYFLHVYLATPEGFFEYVPAGHHLQKLAGKDLRAALSTQKTVSGAPAVFVITGDFARGAQGAGAETAARFINLEAGHAAQNVLLQATALGLGAVPVGGIDPKQIQSAAPVAAQSTPIYLIPVGHPQ